MSMCVLIIIYEKIDYDSRNGTAICDDSKNLALSLSFPKEN